MTIDTAMVTEQQIFDELKRVLVETFEIDPAAVVPEAKLYDDLDLDSIDAVDLLVKLRPSSATETSPPTTSNRCVLWETSSKSWITSSTTNATIRRPEGKRDASRRQRFPGGRPTFSDS